MPTKNKSTKNKQHRRRHANHSTSGRPGRPAIHSVGAAQIRAIEPQYILWRARTIPAEQAVDEWHRLAALLDLYAVENHFGSLDALETVPLASLMDSVVNEFPDSARFLLGLVDRYLHFLAETGHWKRSQGSLSALHILFACGESPLCHRSPLRQSGVVITDPQQLPLVRWAAAVIQGLGEPKPGYPSISTDTGDLVSEVAALESLASVARPRIPELVRAMVLANLISFDGRRALPTPTGNHLVKTGDKDFVDAVRRLMEAYVALLLLEASGLMQDDRPPEHALMLMAFLAHVSETGSIPVSILEINWWTNSVDGAREIAEWLDPLAPGILACLESGLLGSADGNLVAPPLAREVFDTIQARCFAQVPRSIDNTAA